MRWSLLAIAAFLLLPVPTLVVAVFPSVTQATGIVEALGAIAVGVALMLAPSHIGWATYPLDWLGAALLAGGVTLGEAALGGGDLAGLAIFGATIFIYRSEYRRWRPMLAAICAHAKAAVPAPVRFREDGERIVIYPSRWRLAHHAQNAGLLALMAGGLTYLLRGFGPVVMAGLGFFAALGLLVLLCDLPRLLWRWPALIVTSDGIIDRASGGVTGYGLTPWHEIEAVREEGGGALGFYAELAITPLSSSRLARRLPLLKRVYLDLIPSWP